MTTGCVLDLGVWMISNAHVCPVCPSIGLPVCVSLGMPRVEKWKISLSVSLSLPPSPPPSPWWDLWQEDRPHQYFPISLPPQKLCLSPTLITFRDLTAGWGRLEGKSQKWELGARLPSCAAPWEWTSPAPGQFVQSRLHLRQLIPSPLSSHVVSVPLPKPRHRVLPRTWIWGTKLPALLENPVLCCSPPQWDEFLLYLGRWHLLPF